MKRAATRVLNPLAAGPLNPPAQHLAAFNGAEESLRLLLAHGAAPDARNAEDETALHLAACHAQAGCMRRLLAAGADPHARNKARRSETQHALRHSIASRRDTRSNAFPHPQDGKTPEEVARDDATRTVLHDASSAAANEERRRALREAADQSAVIAQQAAKIHALEAQARVPRAA